MRSKGAKDISIILTSFFMKCAGFWPSANITETYIRNSVLAYTVLAVIFAVWVTMTDFYHSQGNFSAAAYKATNVMTSLIVLYKVLILFQHRHQIADIIHYTRKNFWYADYDEYEGQILNQCKKKCIFFVCSFTFFAQGTVFCYTITPIIENIGRNESDRRLPFTMWLDLPFSITPYFEATFVIQVLSMYHAGICYFCFDSFLCIMSIHVAGQFRILQYRMRLLKVEKKDDDGKKLIEKPRCAFATYEKFCRCIREHKALINYCVKLEKIFTINILGQVLAFSILICLVGYQVLLADAAPMRRAIFMFHISGTMCQLMMLTYSCDGLIEQSVTLADAAYMSPWIDLPMNKPGKMLRKDLIMIIAKARRPCCLTAGGFFPVSLETYTTVLSTAMSYFTLLRQRTIEMTES